MPIKKNIVDYSDGKKLREYMDSVPFGDYLKTLNAMVEACKVPKYTFQNWMCCRCRIPELAKDAIEQVAGKKIF